MTERFQNGNHQTVREREFLYRLIISQLRYDGYESAALVLAKSFSSYPLTAPSSRLSHRVKLGVQMEGEVSRSDDTSALPHVRGKGIMDLEFEADEDITSPPAHKDEMRFVASYKEPVLCARFSEDGKLAACGSADNSIKILDVERMCSRQAVGHPEFYPNIRTLYDHIDAILTVRFHPSFAVLASGSNDYTVKFFDHTTPLVKKAYRVLNEVAPVRCLSFHPAGEYMLLGTDQ